MKKPHAKPHKTYTLTSGQIYNLVLAARGKSGCKKANSFVENLDKKFKPKKGR